MNPQNLRSRSPGDPLPWLVFMLKAPRVGQVKTRLAADIGAARATELYRRFVEILIARLSDGRDRWQTVIAYDPPDAEPEMRSWLGEIAAPATRFIPQAGGDLGARLETAFATAFEAGAPSVLALGADCLEIERREIEEAFERLAAAPLVMGPAMDGGYWTIGLSALRFEIFREMPWSRPDLAQRTRECAATHGLKMTELPTKRDVDTLADLESLPAEIKKQIEADSPNRG